MTKTDKMSSYGLYLQSLRVEKGISIEQVAAETRIRSEILKSIEAEDHQNLPDDVFVKGFLQSFAKVIGADPDEVLRRFDVRRKAQAPVQVLPGLAPSPRPRHFWLTLLWVAALMVGLVGGTLLVYQMLYHPEGAEAPPPPVADKAEAVEPDTQPAPAAVQPEPPAKDVPQTNAAETQPARYHLEIVCDEDTWMKIIVDDAPAEEYFLKPGDTLQLTANSNYNLLIGNAGGVSVQLDGKPVPVPGNSGQVVNLQLP
jgi:cytoskeleton protein RodZ